MKLTRVTLFAGVFFLYAPIILLVFYSFNASRLVTVWGGFSSQWYFTLFKNTAMMEAAYTSLKLALLTGFFATIIGSCAAFALNRYGQFKSKGMFQALLAAPLILPETIFAMALLLFFVGLGVDRGFITVLIAHITFTLCFVFVIMQSAFAQFDWAQDEAARDLGAKPWQSFMRVVLPQILPSLMAAFLLSFTLSLDDLILASFASGPGTTTLPMRIYSQARLGLTPEINALSTLILIAVTVMVIFASRLLNKKGQQVF